MKEWLNLDQDSRTLDTIHGMADYYWYLRSPEFVRAFLRPLAALAGALGDSVLDAGCGEGALGNYIVHSRYVGFDGSENAIARGRNRNPFIALSVDRIEEPAITGQFDVLVLGGILEVLIKPHWRAAMIDWYKERFGIRYLIIYDLERLDTSFMARAGVPVAEMHLTAQMPEGPVIEDVKLARKIMAWRLQ